MRSFYVGVLDDERWAIDVLLPPGVRTTADDLRRGRLLVIAAMVLSAASGFFALTSYQSNQTFDGVTAVLTVGAVVAISNLPLLWAIGLKSCSTLLAIEHVFFVWVCAFAGSGAVDASVWWLAPAPLVATVLLGSRAGLLSAVACAAGVLILFLTAAYGLVTYRNHDPDYPVFVTMASITVFVAVAGLAWANERSRERSEARVDEALERLQQANDKLSQVAAALTTARDQAVADGSRKTAFLDDMRQFSLAQTEALARARTSTERLTTTIGAIAGSVDTLAAATRGSSGAIDGVAGAAGRVKGTSNTLVGAVDEVAGALGALRGAVNSVQQGFGGLKTQAQETARAMGTMEGSTQAVREAAGRTAALSSGVIDDAERGAQAVTRSKSGVDAIRQTAILLQTAMAELVERTEAVDRILAVIDDVAVETNVLALNASIIAAQAGEHGRGFSIVAEQIKGLAARVATSTRESAAVIDDVKGRAKEAGGALRHAIDAVDAGQTLSHEAALALDQILKSATETTTMARSIEGRTLEQASQAALVRSAMQLVLAAVEGAARATGDHARAADRIAEAVSRLKLLAPELSAQASDQAAGADAVRSAMNRVAAMAGELRDVQQEQTHASQQVSSSVAELHQAQQGVDAALGSLRA